MPGAVPPTWIASAPPSHNRSRPAGHMPRSVSGMDIPYLDVASVPWGAVVSLIGASLAIMGSPGPSTISLTAAASAHGVRKSLRYMAGLVVGTMAVLVAVATGI